MADTRELFTLPENNTPSNDWRIAIGKGLTAARNMTLTAFYALLESKLNFLKKSSNLSDIASPATARTNLGVYSKAEVDAKVGTGAELLQPGSGKVLGLANAFDPSINPALPYAPATQGYAVSKGFILKGRLDIGDAQGDTGEHVVSFGTTLPSSNYLVFLQAESTHDAYGDDICLLLVINRTTTSFTIYRREYFSGKYGNKQIAWAVTML